MQESRFQKLIEIYGDRLICETESYPEYAKDASELNFKPSSLFFAESTEEVLIISKACHDNSIPVIARGAGTGYTGGCVPSKGALVLSLERMDQIDIDPNKKIAFCGPGVITLDLMNLANDLNLYYPPDPASIDECTLGGNIAENAGGLHCKKYGVTKDYVVGLKAVTPNGKLIETGVYSQGELFDLASVITGSEGILAIVTEIAVRLIEKTEIGPTMLASFSNSTNAANSVSEIIGQGIIPSVMEYMDGDAVSSSIDYEKSVEIAKAEAVLLLETDGKNAVETAKKIEAICIANNVSTFLKEADKNRSERLWKIRRNLSKAVKASAREKISEDVCVPPSKLPLLVDFVARLNSELPVRVNSYGHAGDGNLHVNFLTKDNDPDYGEVIDKKIAELFKMTLELGGTLTGEHGIGLTKREFLKLEFDPNTIIHMKNIKFAFDSMNLFNPGKLFSD